MIALNSFLVLAFAFLAVFGQAVFPGVRHLLGAQVDLLPVLMVYAALNTNVATVALLAVLGGLCFDALSANPLGVTILPLFIVGFAILSQRELILHKLSFAQIVLGAVACAVVPALTVLLLLTAGAQPLLGWGSLWQWLVMTAGGAVATPVLFALFAWCNHALGYQPRTETSFRPDREIHRGRK
ncbi:MAG: rod shape-determining protein MreD [Verrucomicrobiota bacterium]